MRDGGIGAEEDAFDPTEDSSVGANSQSQAEDRKDGKARAAPEHAEPEAEVLQSGLDHGQSSLVAVDFLGLLDAAKTAKRFAAGIRRRHAFAQVNLDGHLQMRTQFVVQVLFETTAAKERGDAMEQRAEAFTHNLGTP